MICDFSQVSNINHAAIFAVMENNDYKTRLRRAGKTNQDLAELLKVHPSAITRLLNGTRGISRDEAIKIEAFLGDAYEQDMPQQRKIPLYGYAAANNNDRIALVSDKILDWIDAPPFSKTTTEYAAIRVIGESMEPRLFAGEELIIAKNLYPARGKDCVIEFKDGSAAVKTFLRNKEGLVYFQQYNPNKEVSFKYDDIKQLHQVMWRN